MLVLFETPGGYAIFKLLDKKTLSKTEDLFADFENPEKANQILKLKHFQKFLDTTEALASTTAAIEGKVSKTLKKALKKVFKESEDELLVADSKLGNAVKDKFNVPVVSNSAVQELMRCIRSQTESLLSGLPKKEFTAMALGLAHRRGFQMISWASNVILLLNQLAKYFHSVMISLNAQVERSADTTVIKISSASCSFNTIPTRNHKRVKCGGSQTNNPQMLKTTQQTCYF